MHSLSFCDQLVLLCVMSSWFVHDAENGGISFSVKVELYSVAFLYCIFIVLTLPVDI